MSKQKLPMCVVIPTYNRPKVLKATIESYLSGVCLPEQIVVVDQSEKQFDLSCLEEFYGVELDVIRSTTPSSTLARNIGARASKYDVLLFSDDDILVDKDSVRMVFDSMNEETQALVAGVDLKENALYGDAKKSSIAKDIAGMLLGLKKPWRKDGYVVKLTMRGRYPAPVNRSVPTEWAMGYFFCVRRSLMERWNVWFDESLERYAYAEDLDFSMRYCVEAKKAGLKTSLEPSIYVNHLASVEWRTPSAEAVRYFVKNRRHIIDKLYPNSGFRKLLMTCMDTMFAISQLPNDKAYAICLLKTLYSRQ